VVFDKVKPSAAPPCLVDLIFGPDEPDGGVDKASGDEHKDGGKSEEKVKDRHLPQSMMMKTAMASVQTKAVLPPRYVCVPFPAALFSPSLISYMRHQVIPSRAPGPHRRGQRNLSTLATQLRSRKVSRNHFLLSTTLFVNPMMDFSDEFLKHNLQIRLWVDLLRLRLRRRLR
jgi:hypothetical protein